MAETTILLGSADPARLEFMKSVLNRAGYRAIGVSSAAQGVKTTRAGAERLHLIVIDRTLEESEAAPLWALYPRVPVLAVANEDSAELVSLVRRRLEQPNEERA